MAINIGSAVEAGLDEMGAPEWAGDLAGAVTDAAVIVLATQTGAAAVIPELLPDLLDNLKDLGTKEASHGGASSAGYPGREDAAGWTAFVQKNGYEAFRTAFENGEVDSSVFRDPAFAMALQDALQDENRYWELMSNLSSAKDRMLSSIVSNMRA